MEPEWLAKEIITGERAGIYSRIPSHRSNTFYVFVECAITVGTCTGSQEKFWVSTKKQTPQGFVPYCTVHLKRLGWRTRAMIWTGRIKWLFILRNSESQKEEKR
jgi:hypothetical protein